MKDKHYRSIVKAISWRTLGTIDTMIVSFFVTGDLVMAVSIGSIEVVTKIVIYYLHERVWEKIDFGRVKVVENDYQI